jgi:hypothetical protein
VTTEERLRALLDEAKGLAAILRSEAEEKGTKLAWEAATCADAALYDLFGAWSACALASAPL